MSGRHMRKPRPRTEFERTMRYLAVVMVAAAVTPILSFAVMIWRHL